MSKATRRLPEALAALRLLATVAGLLPFGDKLSAGVNVAINLCEAVQTAKSNQSAYEDLSSRCTSLLLSVATCLRAADPNKRPIVIKNMEALVQTLIDVHQAAEASFQRSDTAKSRLSTRIIRPLKDMVRAKKDEEEIQQLQEKITNMFAEFQLESHMRLEISTQNIADMVVDIRQEQEAQRKRIAEIQDAQAAAARDADNALLNQLDPVHAALHDSDTLAMEVSTCLEDTRVALLAKLDEWRASPDSAPFFWLNGLAGTGKSTIARTFCQRVASSGAAPVLLASFFISRQSADRRSAVNIVHTVAYQLALRSEGIRLAICRAMRDQADLLRRPLREQVSKLVAVPLVELQPADLFLIVIDALDECDKDAKGREGGELIPLLCAAFYSATSSVKLLVTSRLESTIRTTFEEVKQATSAQVVLKLHNIDYDVVRGDLRRYLVHSLRVVAARVPDVQDSAWPSDADIDTLVNRAGVLFIWAATIVRFVDSEIFDPRQRLHDVLTATKSDSASPYWRLDQLYLQVLNQAVNVGDGPRQDRDALVQRLRTIVGTVIVLQRQLPPDALAALIGLGRHEVKAMLERLSSVLVVNGDEPVRALHPSFADFLTDSSRCNDPGFFVSESAHHADTAVRCLSVLNGRLRRDICSLKDEIFYHRGTPNFDEWVARCIPTELDYACCYCFDHLGKSVEVATVLGKLETFARTHILHWLECMSILDEMETAVSGVSRALKWCQAQEREKVANTTFDSVIPLLNDAASLLGEYYHPVCADPLQLYRSALLFMPSCALSMAASDDLLDIRLLSPRNPAWTSDVLIFQSTSSPFQGIQCIVVSPDDALVAAVYEDSRSPVKVWKTSTGQMLRTWTSNDSDRFHALTISFSLDGKQLAIMTPGAVYWWDPHTDIHRIQPIDLKIPTFIYNLLSHSVISADGARLAVGFSHDIGDSLLQSVDLNTGGLRTLLRNVVITSVAVSSDASRIASSSDDGNLRIWNAKDGVLLSTLNNFGLPAVVLAFTPRHDIVTMTDDGTVRMRGAEGCDTVFTLGNIPIAADRKVLSQTGFYSRNNSHMISASALYPLVAIATSEIVFVWDEDTRQLVARRQLYVDPSGEAHRWDGPDTAVAFMSDRPGLIVAPRQEDMSLWNFQAQQTAADTPLVDSVGGAVYSVRFSHDGCFVISGSDGSDLRVWETCSGGLKATIRTSHTHPVTAAEFALRDRSLVLSGSDGGQNMELREAETCRLLQQFDASSRMKIANQLIDFSRDGSQFVTMSRDSSSNILRLYESHTGKVLAEERQSKYFTAISFLPDGSRIIALSNLSMKSWSTLTQPPLRDSRITKIQNLGALPWHVLDTFACSPDSERIVSVSVYQEIHLWHARTGKEIRTSSKFTLLDVETPVPAELNDRHHILRYSPTTRGRFLSCSWAGVVRIWNDDTLEIEKTFTVNHMGRAISHLNHVPAVTACYSPDGERITVAFEHRSRTGQGQIHELKVYEWSTGQLIKELAPIISYDAHEDPGSYRDNFRSTMRLSFSPDGQYVFFLKAGRPRVEVWSLLNGEYIGSLWSPMRTMWTAFSICPVTARLIATCEPKSIAHQVAEAATVSSEVVAQSGLAGVDGTAMCLSIVQDLFEANQTYLCVWDTHGFQLQSTLRCGHDGFQPPHFCFDQGSRTLLKQAPPRHYTAPTVCQIPRLQRPNIIVRLGEWVEFIMRPDGSSPRHYYAEDREDQDRFIKLCYTPADRRPLASALMKSERCPWGPVAVHEHVVAIGSLRGSVTIIDLTSLMLTLESRREKLEEEG